MRERPLRRAVAALMAIQLAACVHAATSTFSDPLNEFEMRRAHGSGRYLSSADLGSDDALPLSQVLSTRLLGFASTLAAQRSGTSPSNCGMDVYVNGLSAPGALDQLHARDLAGVEFYQAATAPARYRRVDSACPVLLLWLKAYE